MMGSTKEKNSRSLESYAKDTREVVESDKYIECPKCGSKETSEYKDRKGVRYIRCFNCMSDFEKEAIISDGDDGVVEEDDIQETDNKQKSLDRFVGD